MPSGIDLIERSASQARAAELRAQGEHRAARRIEECERSPASYWRCRRRDCPVCARELAAGYAARARAVVVEMRRPVLVLAGVDSHGEVDLGSAIGRLRTGLRVLRGRVVTRGIWSAVGLVEPELRRVGSGGRWVAAWRPHVHLVCDAAGSVEWGAVAAAWAEVAGHGAVWTLDGGDGAIRDLEAVCAYATKWRTWCPVPGSMPRWALRELRRSLRGRRLMVEWRPRAAEWS